MTAHPERRGFYSRFAPKRLEWWTPSIAEVLSGIKSKNSSWAVSDAISRSRKHGVTIFFHLSKLNWFGKLYIKVTRQNGRPNCLDGHQAVGKAMPGQVFAGSEAKHNNDKSSRGFHQARAKHCVCAHSSCIAPVSLQNLLKKHMEEQDSHKTQRLRRQQLRSNSKPTKKLNHQERAVATGWPTMSTQCQYDVTCPASN